MSTKKRVFISTIVGAVATIAVATVTYLDITQAVQINTAINIAATAVIDILMVFAPDTARNTPDTAA